MATRYRSKDGHRETEAMTGDAPKPSQQGRFQGNLERKVGTRDELRHATNSSAGTTRVRKSDEKGQGDLGGHHGTGQDND
jgi:hypothetical protein